MNAECGFLFFILVRIRIMYIIQLQFHFWKQIIKKNKSKPHTEFSNSHLFKLYNNKQDCYYNRCLKIRFPTKNPSMRFY